MVHIDTNELPDKKRTPGDSLSENSGAEDRLRGAVEKPETRVAFGGESWLPPVPTAPRTNPPPVPSADSPRAGNMEGNSGQPATPSEEVRRPEVSLAKETGKPSTEPNTKPSNPDPHKNTPKEQTAAPTETQPEGKDASHKKPTPSPNPGERVSRDGTGQSETQPTTTGQESSPEGSPLGERLREIREKGEAKIKGEAAEAAQPVIDENNRGMEAWHDAMKERNALSESERRGGEKGKNVDKKIDGLRDGTFPDGSSRQFPPEDAPVAVEAKVRSLSPTSSATPSRPARDISPSASPGNKKTGGYRGNPEDRDASLGNSIDV